MTGIPFSKCLGIDTRPQWGEDAYRMAICSNLWIEPGGAMTTRPGLVKLFDLHAQSKGLYARGGALRAAIPGGATNYAANPPAGVIYDRLGQGSAFDYTDKIVTVLDNDTWGNDPVQGPRGYLAIQLTNGAIEHHYIQTQPSSTAAVVNTRVVLPYTPGPALVKTSRKIMAPDPGNGYLRFCSAVNGPTDWTTPLDAGFEYVQQFVDGSRTMVTLGVHRGISPFGGSTPLVAIFYEDSLQMWYMDVTPANDAQRQILNGAGTKFPLSPINVQGDMFWLGLSGFANLVNQTVTYEARYADIGAAIKTLSDTIVPGSSVIGMWSQARQQMLWANGSTVYVMNYYPLFDEKTWTTWTLPVTVDAICESVVNGKLVVCIRSGTAVYMLDDTQGSDFPGTVSATPIRWTWQLQGMGMGSNTLNKELRRMTVSCTGKGTYTPIRDGIILPPNAITLPGGNDTEAFSLFARGKRLAVQGTGTGKMVTTGMEFFAEEGGP